MAVIARLFKSVYPEGLILPDLPKGDTGDLVPTKAGAAVTAGRFVVLAADDTYYDMCGDNAVKVSGLALTTATAEGETIRIRPIMPGDIYEIAYATGGSKTSFTATDIGTNFGMETNGKVDPDNTTNDLFMLQGYDNDADVAYVTFLSACIVGTAAEA